MAVSDIIVGHAKYPAISCCDGAGQLGEIRQTYANKITSNGEGEKKKGGEPETSIGRVRGSLPPPLKQIGGVEINVAK